MLGGKNIKSCRKVGEACASLLRGFVTGMPALSGPPWGRRGLAQPQRQVPFVPGTATGARGAAPPHTHPGVPQPN